MHVLWWGVTLNAGLGKGAEPLYVVELVLVGKRSQEIATSRALNSPQGFSRESLLEANKGIRQLILAECPSS